MRPPPLKIAGGSDDSSSSSRDPRNSKNKAVSSPRRSKPPLPGARRGPVIIHTYSPKVIQTSTQDFMELVQRLTGSSDTRLRCKKTISTKSTKVSSSFSSSSSKKFKSRLAHSNASDDHPGGVYKPTRPNLPEEMDDGPHDDDHSSSQGLAVTDDLSLGSFKSPLLASHSSDEHINLSVGTGDSMNASLAAATPAGGSLGWSSPIPTPNFLLQHDLFKDLPLLSPVFSPAWPHQVGRYASS
ncbi:uncharacterized protein LOC9633427 [Selaginella moellendorffii]|uniref:uncharacterized protein LOC9633427 n=1 Tax=Selaginella moellendorffii TaxID=88036 RepID=UPI000D1C5A85|nr:uncharacterized protein LOC9633427 [Selaginella moellendorffii]|eukprot:XP_024521329.1 uncharacterized protein LOC9633427 [Selaginella moellendorffii]